MNKKYIKMIERNEKRLKWMEERNRCKVCKVQFDSYNVYWYHQKKCNVNIKFINELNIIYKQLQNDAIDENQENNDEYIKKINDIIKEINSDAKYELISAQLLNLLKRIHKLSKKNGKRNNSYKISRKNI